MIFESCSLINNLYFLLLTFRVYITYTYPFVIFQNYVLNHKKKMRKISILELLCHLKLETTLGVIILTHSYFKN